MRPSTSSRNPWAVGLVTSLAVTAGVLTGTGSAHATGPTTATLAQAGAHAGAEDTSVIADFSFDDAATGFTGAGAKAEVRGTLALGDGPDGTRAARLSSGFWLDVTKDDGSPLLAGLDEVTISYDSRPSATGNTGWSVAAQRSAATNTFRSEHYLGVLDRSSSVTVERYDNDGTTRDTSGNLVATGTPSGWKHVDIVISGTSGRLYVDGLLVASNTQGKLLSTILGASGGVLQLGKANWGSAGEYFSGLLDNVSVHSAALTESQIQQGAAQRVYDRLPGSLTIEDSRLVLPGAAGVVSWASQMDSVSVEADGRTAQVVRPAPGDPAETGVLTATITVGEHVLTKQVEVAVVPLPTEEEKAQQALAAISLPGLHGVRSNLTLPTIGKYDLPLTWRSSNPAVITDDEVNGVAPGVVTRGADDQTVTLTVSAGESVRRFTALVRARVTAPVTTDYLFAHFTGIERSANDEQIYFATSSDGDTWADTRPNGSPVLASTIGDKGVRDPYLVRSPEGDTFYLIATDLSIFHRGGWGNAQATETGSLSLVVWRSHDLVHWSPPQLTDVASRIPGAGMAWAPEAFWDAAQQQYVVYWATKSAPTNGIGDPVNVYYATTRDFVTFSDPVKWIDRNHSIIDTSMIKVDDWYYRASGDGQITIERSKNLYATSTATQAEAYVDDQHWSLVGTLQSIFNNSAYSGAALEGPEFFAYNEDDLDPAAGPLWGLLADQYAAGRGYLPFRSTDIGDPTTDSWSAASDVSFGNLKKRHGTILPITAEELAAVQAAAVGSTGVLVDETAPTLSSVSVTSPREWHTSAPSLTWSAGDDTGAEPGLEIRVDGEWAPYAGGPVDGLDQGTNTVQVRAVDDAGNRSAPTEVTLGLDSVPPATAAAVDETRTVTLTASDTTSGVAAVEYSMDGSTWSPYTAPVAVGADPATMWFRARDVAGNLESAQSIVVPDSSSPKSALTSTPVPGITGAARVGSMLTAAAGRWEPAPVSLSYQWSRSGVPVGGATGATYQLRAADRGHRISVTVTGSKPGYLTVSSVSRPTTPVAAGRLAATRPRIKGTPEVGRRLRATAGSWGPVPVRLSYQWYRAGKVLAGATRATYVVRRADRGKRITVKVTGRKPGYTTTVLTSKPTEKAT